MKTANLLLEIGTEEIPSGYFSHILDMLSCGQGSPVKELFDARNIMIGSARAYSTPRRIVLCVDDIPLCQNVNIDGPPARIAFDDGKNPTKALEAFLNKNNASVDDIETYEGEKEPRVRLLKKDVSNKQMLEELIPKIVARLDFPKTMRWDSSGISFARPIRWILALFGNDTLRFSVGRVESSNLTNGHRFFGHRKIVVKDPDSYFKIMEKNNVLLDDKARKEKILSYLRKKNWVENRELVEEVNYLVEYPFFIEGVFRKEYLELPREVLLASMAKHQRVFCLKDKKGNLKNSFAAVINGKCRGRNTIKAHYENVLDARLKDALFFYDSDIKIKLSRWAEGLDGVVFHKQLGTLKDKVARLKNIAQFLTKYIDIDPDEKKSLNRAISLCKADLLSSMVREFPSLQGIVGKYYALASGEDEDAAEAIGEHYLPRFADDDVPASGLGTICSLADKFDNIASYFKIGKFPKGGWDLYALRRQSIGIISILLKRKISLDLGEIFDYTYEISPGEYDKEKLRKIYIDFFRERFVSFVKERFSYRYDLLDSVMVSGECDLYKSFLKLESLNSIIDEIYFESARCVVERTHNIIRPSKRKAEKVKASLFKEQEEGQLWNSFNSIKEKVESLCLDGKYPEATRLFGEGLFAVIHNFFDKVMVNVDSKDLKENRIALLSAINKLYVDNIADLSKIVISKESND
ncbi:MAG: glycine--tRNA ligase subunit beta [Candidatus Omnitrophota bacterium]